MPAISIEDTDESVVVPDCVSSAPAAGVEIITDDSIVVTESIPAIIRFILLVLIATVKSTFLKIYFLCWVENSTC